MKRWHVLCLSLSRRTSRKKWRRMGKSSDASICCWTVVGLVWCSETNCVQTCLLLLDSVGPQGFVDPVSEQRWWWLEGGIWVWEDALFPSWAGPLAAWNAESWLLRPGVFAENSLYIYIYISLSLSLSLSCWHCQWTWPNCAGVCWQARPGCRAKQIFFWPSEKKAACVGAVPWFGPVCSWLVAIFSGSSRENLRCLSFNVHDFF